MLTQSRYSEVALAKRTVQVLPPDTEQVTCRSGSIWITQDGDTEDIILQPGERFEPSPKRRAVLYGLEASIATLRQHFPSTQAGGRAQAGRSAGGLVLE